nr:hypothetical protein HUO10_004643 [Paraburkholderia busanensis]
MRRNHLYVAALAACLSLSAFAVSASTHGQHSFEVAIKAENTRWAEAFGRGDYKAIGRLYTEDGALLPPGGERIIGANAITEYFTKGHTETTPDILSFSNEEFYGDGKAMTEVSDAEIRDQRGNVKFRGKQILIFVMQGGVWKLHRDMWSSSSN